MTPRGSPSSSREARTQSAACLLHVRTSIAITPAKLKLTSLPAAILTQHTPQNAWLPVLRPYTPISDPSTRGSLQLLVKKYPSGRASGYMHSLNPGDSLTVRGPIPGYAYQPSTSQERNIVLIAGGAGITPIYSLARSVLEEHPEDKTKVQLLWGVNGTRDIVLHSELQELERRFPERLSVTYAVSGPEAAPDAPQPLGDESKYKKGYVNKELMQQAVARAGGAWGDEKGTKVFLCGPPKMEEALAGETGVLTELGLAKKEIHRF